MLHDFVDFADAILSFAHPTEPVQAKTTRFSKNFPSINRLDYNGLKEWEIEQIDEQNVEQIDEQNDFVPVFYKMLAVKDIHEHRRIDNDEDLEAFKKAYVKYYIQCVFTYERRVDVDTAAQKRARTTALLSDITNLLHARVAQLENRLVAGGVTLDA